MVDCGKQIDSRRAFYGFAWSFPARVSQSLHYGRRATPVRLRERSGRRSVVKYLLFYFVPDLREKWRLAQVRHLSLWIVFMFGAHNARRNRDLLKDSHTDADHCCHQCRLVQHQVFLFDVAIRWSWSVSARSRVSTPRRILSPATAAGAGIAEQRWPAAASWATTALGTGALRQQQDGRQLIGVGHRGCMAARSTRGRSGSRRSCWTNCRFLRAAGTVAPAAHLAPIRILLDEMPELLQVACFDTAFIAATGCGSVCAAAGHGCTTPGCGVTAGLVVRIHIAGSCGRRRDPPPPQPARWW